MIYVYKICLFGNKNMLCNRRDRIRLCIFISLRLLKPGEKLIAFFYHLLKTSGFKGFLYFMKGGPFNEKGKFIPVKFD